MINMFFQKIKSIILAKIIGPDALLPIYKIILKSRLLDLELLRLYKEGKIKKILYSGIGQEAASAVASSFLTKKDYLVPHYRGYAHVLAKGISLQSLVSEIFGKSGGLVEGKGSFGNFLDLDNKIFPYSITLGQGFGVAVGMGFALKYKKEDGIITMFFGDGASTRAPFYSAINIAALWSLPIFFVCDNNQYSISKKFNDTSLMNLTTKIQAFGMKCAIADGNDIIDVYRKTKHLIHFVREESKPVFLELNTYRVVGHNCDDSGWYQDDTKRREACLRDPLSVFSDIFIKAGIMSKEDITSWSRLLQNQIKDAIESVDKEPMLDIGELEKELYG